MRKITATVALSATALVVALLVAPPPRQSGASTHSASPQAGTAGSTSNCLAPPFIASTAPGKYGYTTPKDIALTRQADANCFAWQEFISLNWIASAKMRGQPDTNIPPAAFGKPNDPRPVVWETYKESDEVFLPGATKPPAWNTWPGGGSLKALGGMKSEVDPQPNLDLSDIGQASQGHPWLTAQSKLLTLYERRMNEDEFNYIVNNGLYNAATQQTFVQSPGINLPDGTAATAAYGPLGSIETKAAWIELPNNVDWPRFKISRANVSYPPAKPGGPPIVRKNVVVGLVGLHIIHKTALGQQFIWATFEHRENCPDKDQVASGKLNPPYTYYNPKCNPATDHYKCVANANPATYNGGKNPYTAPIQVVRATPIASRPNDDVKSLNEFVWSLLSADSVYRNYELVNTLWSNQNTPIAAGAHVPLFAGQLSPGPSQEPVSNTMLETYVQSLTCLDCHASAAIAKLKPAATTKIFDPATAGTAATHSNPFASDYSFLLDNAKQPSARKR